MRSYYYFLLLFFTICHVMTSCSTTTSSSSSTSASSATEEYQALPADKSISNFVNKKIWFEGKISTIIHQHMMKSSPFGDEKHLYVDYNTTGGQTVAYYKEGIRVPSDENSHKFYGTVGSMSGAGKGGGTHTEYYLDLDKVE